MACKAELPLVVVGGGITGVFSAYFLARFGVQTTLIERGELAGQASGSNAGGLNPLHGPGIPGPMQEFALQSLQLHRESWEQLGEPARARSGARLVPRLHVAMDGAEASELEATAALHNATEGFSARLLHREELLTSEPRVSPDAVAGLWTEGNARVDPAPYTRAIAAAAVQLGARLLRGEVEGLRHANGCVSAVTVDGEQLACRGVVIACGPWCAEPSLWLGTPLPVEPVKGELLLAEPDGQGAPAAEISWRQYGVYFAAGSQMWLGGTEERAGYDRAPSEAGREQILAGIRRMLPGLGEPRVVCATAGLRPVSADGLPIVGIPPGWENVCVAVGGGRKGMLLGAGLGCAAAELLVHERTRLAIDPCAPRNM